MGELDEIESIIEMKQICQSDEHCLTEPRCIRNLVLCQIFCYTHITQAPVDCPAVESCEAEASDCFSEVKKSIIIIYLLHELKKDNRTLNVFPTC